MKSLKNNFTLLELLVVIGVIAILLSMLLPSLKTGVDIAKRIQCVSNHKQTYAVWLMYGSDNDGRMPLLMSRYAEISLKAGGNYNTWAWNPPAKFLPKWQHLMFPETFNAEYSSGAFDKAMGFRRLKSLHCPAVKGIQKPWLNSSVSVSVEPGAYVMITMYSHSIGGHSDDTPGGNGLGWSYPKKFIRYSDITLPSKRGAFGDALQPAYLGDGTGWGVAQRADLTRFRYPGAKTNCIYADGHVDRVSADFRALTNNLDWRRWMTTWEP